MRDIFYSMPVCIVLCIRTCTLCIHTLPFHTPFYPLYIHVYAMHTCLLCWSGSSTRWCVHITHYVEAFAEAIKSATERAIHRVVDLPYVW